MRRITLEKRGKQEVCVLDDAVQELTCNRDSKKPPWVCSHLRTPLGGANRRCAMFGCLIDTVDAHGNVWVVRHKKCLAAARRYWEKKYKSETT